MKKRTINLIVLLTTISLFGVIITQLFWIVSALDLAKEHYDHRVSFALKNAISELVIYNKTQNEAPPVEEPFSASKDKIVDGINTVFLDSLLRVHFIYQNLDESFEYEIVSSKTDSLIYSKRGILSDNFSCVPYKACIASHSEPKPRNLHVYFPDKQLFILNEILSWLIISFLFTCVVILGFVYTIKSLKYQKRLVEVKNAFFKNMTHELQTPISTISLASDILLNYNGKNTDRLHRYIEVINQENKRLKLLVERVLETSKFENNKVELHKTKLNIHDLIEQIVENVYRQQSEKTVNLQFKFGATRPILMIDQTHFSNILVNLLDNASKYSGENPEVSISTTSNRKGVSISVCDNGIGMTSNDQKMIFDKYFRIYDGNVHDVKGYGLGLHYVKTMIEAHMGSIKVKSETNKGSEFVVFLPFSS